MMEFFNVSIAQQSIDYVVEVLKSGFLNEGKQVRQFEDELVPFLGKKPLAMSSCTAALRLALTCAGVHQGHEVLVPTQTFVASFTVVGEVGADIVFVDIDPKTGNISVADMESKITERTKAVIPVDFGGLPVNLEEIIHLSKKHNITVIEDAAHALGAKYKNQCIGSVSDYTCFSFQAIKMLTCADGGAITFPEAKTKQVQSLYWFGIDKQTVQKKCDERLPSMEQMGFKYNMNNIAASIGMGNLPYLSQKLEKRKQIAALFRRELKSVPGLQLLDVPDGCESANWIFTVLIEDRDRFFTKMKERNIPSKCVNFGIDLEPVFHQTPEQLASRPGQRYFDEHHICIPSHEALTDDDLAHIIGTIRTGW